MKTWKYLGFASLGIFLVFTLISKHLNPWFNVAHYTFSKLGKIGLANYPWIFSAGTIIGGIFMMWYGVEIVKNSIGKLQVLGGGYVLLSGIFMALIGLFPDGTKPHDFIAVVTFLSFYIGFTLFGFGSNKKAFKFYTAFVFALALIGLLYPHWPSLCYLEIYGISLVIFDMVIMLFFA